MLSATESRFAAFDQAKQQAEIDRRYGFEREASEFVVESWNAFIDAYHDGNLDLREASELSREFRKLEKRGGGW